MPRHVYPLLGLLLLISVSAVHAAVPVPGACPPIGTKLAGTFDGKLMDNIIVTKADGLLCSLNGPKGPFLRYGVMLGRNGTTIEDDGYTKAVAQLWPLAVGKTASYVDPSHPTWDWQWTDFWTVTGKKTITVPAGTFETFEVELVGRTIGYNGGNASFRWLIYVSTDLGFQVKTIHKLGNDKNPEWELVSVTKP